jgi:PAS domain S-box-containing protein
MKLKTGRLALKVALIYFFAAGMWILFSDPLLGFLVKNHDTLVELSAAKGLMFVAISAGLLFLLLRRKLRELADETEERQMIEARYRNLFESMNEGVAYCRMIYEAGQPVDFVYVTVNGQFTALTGLKDVVGKPVSKVIPGLRTSDPEIMEVYGRVARTGQPEKFERFVHALKMWFTVSVFCPEPGHFVAVFDVITERKRVETALRASEERFRAMFELASIGIAQADPQSGRWLSVNGKMCAITGYTEAEMLQLRIEDITHPADWQADNELFKKVVQGERPDYSMEKRYRRKDGTEVWVNVNMTVIRDATGQPVRTMATIEDITSRKLVEEEVRRKTALFEALVHSSPDGILVVDNESRKVLQNQRMTDLWKIPPEISGNPDDKPQYEYARSQAKDPAEFDEKSRKLAAGNDPQARDEIELKDGTVLERQTSLVTGRDGKFYGRLWNFHDITARKAAAQALQSAQALYTSLVTQLPVGVFQKDEAGRYVLVNPAFCQIKGMPPEDFLGRTPVAVEQGRNVQPNVDSPAGKYAADGEDHHRQILRTGKTIQMEEEYLLANGRKQFVQVIKSPVLDAGGRIIGTQGMLIDITARKQFEEALRRNETILIEGQRLANLGNWEWDVLANRHSWSLEIYRIYGREPELGPADVQEVARYFTPESWSRLSAAVEKALKDGTAYECDAEVVRPDGKHRWITARGEARYDQLGKVVSLHGTVQDITVRKQTEAALHAKEEEFRTLAEAMPQIVWMTGPDGLNIYFNQHWVDYTGLTLAESYGHGWNKPFHPDDQRRAWDAWQYAVHNRGNYSLEARLRRADGTYRWWLVRGEPLRDKGGTVIRWFGTCTDIHELKQTEAAHARLATAVEQSAETIVITDTAGTILYANPAFEKTSGYSRAEVLGQTPRILKSGKQDGEFYRQMWTTITQGKVWRGHFINRQKDGTLYEEDASISPVRDSAGKIVNYVAVKRDLTREVELESQFRQAQKMEAIGQLAGGVAHDFNNILAVIQLQAGMLKADPTLNKGQLEYAKDIEEATNRAAALTKQLLLFSRKQAMQLHDYDLNEVVTSITKMLQRVLGEHIQMQFTQRAHALTVHVDSGMIDQVLMNLTVNARDAMSAGGHLYIETSAVDLDETQVAQLPSARPGSFACLTVRDTGCGMTPEVLTRIYEPFFTTKEHGKGTGLGLATVFGIVQQHQGWINVTSQVGKGTTFRIYLPRRTMQAENIAEWSSLSAILRGHETILLAEDDTTLRASASGTLTRHGYRVLEAASGPEALALWKSHQGEIKLLLTDLLMPGGMTGKELAQTILPANPDLKIIYMSGYSADLVGGDFQLDEGVNFLAKPFTVRKLTQIVRDAFDKK